MTETVDEAERYRAKMAKRKAVQDAEVAEKTIEKGLLIVHTGPGKGKSTAAFGLALRMLGRGRRMGCPLPGRPPGPVSPAAGLADPLGPISVA